MMRRRARAAAGLAWAALSAWSVDVAAQPSGATAAERSGVVAPEPLAPLEVPYPPGQHGDAEVVLELVVAEDGSVVTAEPRGPATPFTEAARLASDGFRFSPATRNGIAIRARIAVRIEFREPAPPPPAPAADTPNQAASPTPPPPPAPAPVEISVLGEQRAELGSIHVPKEDARRVPGAFGDPFRVVEVLPGVAPLLSGLPYFYVRGAPPGSVGYFIDGVRVPVLFHVGPGPSVVAPAMVERVDLFPGAYPVRFGRYAGAILAGETTAPSSRARGEAQARIFDASVMGEQPFAEGRGSVLLGGRYSYTQAILAAVAPDYRLGYGDYQARVSYAVTPTDRLSAFAFGGYDLLKNEEEGLTLFDIAFHRVDLRWDHVTAESRARLGLTFAADEVLAAPEDEGAPGSSLSSRGVRLRGEVEQALGAGVRLRGGGDLGVEHVSGDREQVGDDFRAYPDREDYAGGVYADVVWRPARGIEIVPGARVDFARSRGEDHGYFEPRLSTRTRLAQGLVHLAGVGLAHQLPVSSVRMPGRRPNLLELSEQEAAQLSQGLEYALPERMLGRTTLFYQSVTIDTPGVRGRSYGVEQFVRRDFTERLGGFLSYTLSRAEGLVGSREVLSNFDRTHVLSGVLGYDLGAGFRLGVRGYYASGRAYEVACPNPDCGPGDPTAERTFVRELRLPGFFRVDFRFEKRWRFASGVWLTGAFEWFNASLSSEVEDVDYTARGLYYDRPSPLTLPSIGVELGY